MALPIKPTPRLSEEASERFLARVEADLKKPTSRKDVSKLAEARKIALKHAVLGPK